MGSVITEEVRNVLSGITLLIKSKVLQSLLVILTTLLIWLARIIVEYTVAKGYRLDLVTFLMLQVSKV